MSNMLLQQHHMSEPNPAYDIPLNQFPWGSQPPSLVGMIVDEANYTYLYWNIRYVLQVNRGKSPIRKFAYNLVSENYFVNEAMTEFMAMVQQLSIGRREGEIHVFAEKMASFLTIKVAEANPFILQEMTPHAQNEFNMLRNELAMERARVDAGGSYQPPQHHQHQPQHHTPAYNPRQTPPPQHHQPPQQQYQPPHAPHQYPGHQAPTNGEFDLNTLNNGSAPTQHAPAPQYQSAPKAKRKLKSGAPQATGSGYVKTVWTGEHPELKQVSGPQAGSPEYYKSLLSPPTLGDIETPIIRAILPLILDLEDNDEVKLPIISAISSINGKEFVTLPWALVRDEIQVAKCDVDLSVPVGSGQMLCSCYADGDHMAGHLIYVSKEHLEVNYTDHLLGRNTRYQPTRSLEDDRLTERPVKKTPVNESDTELGLITLAEDDIESVYNLTNIHFKKTTTGKGASACLTEACVVRAENISSLMNEENQKAFTDAFHGDVPDNLDFIRESGIMNLESSELGQVIERLVVDRVNGYLGNVLVTDARIGAVDDVLELGEYLALNDDPIIAEYWNKEAPELLHSLFSIVDDKIVTDVSVCDIDTTIAGINITGVNTDKMVIPRHSPAHITNMLADMTRKSATDNKFIRFSDGSIYRLTVSGCVTIPSYILYRIS